MAAAPWQKSNVEATNTYDEVPFLPFAEGSEDDARRGLDPGEVSREEAECTPCGSRAECDEPDSGYFKHTQLPKPMDALPYQSLYAEREDMTHEQSADFEAMYGACGSGEQYYTHESPEQYHAMNNGNPEAHRSPGAFGVRARWCVSYGAAFLDDGAQPPYRTSDAFDEFDDDGGQAVFVPGAAVHSSRAQWRGPGPGLYQGSPYVPYPCPDGYARRPSARSAHARAPEPNWMRTPGSEGHEEGSCRPCHYIRAKDGCVKGADCDHCHLAHRKATAPKLHPATRRRCLTLVQRVFDAERYDGRRSKAQQDRLVEFLAVNEQLRGYAHSVMKSLKGGAVLRSVSMKL